MHATPSATSGEILLHSGRTALRRAVLPLLLAVFMLAAPRLLAQQCVRSAANGAWSSTATWDQGIPGSDDTVVVSLGDTVLIAGAQGASCAVLRVDGVLLTDSASTATHPLSCGELQLYGLCSLHVGSRTMAVGGDLRIMAGGEFRHRSGRLWVYNWINDGQYTPSPGAWVDIPGNTSGGRSIDGSVVTNFRRLSITLGGTVTALNDVDVTELLSIEAGSTLNMDQYRLTGLTDATTQTSGSGVLRSSNTSPLPIPLAWGARYNVAVDYAGSNQNIVTAEYTELILSGSGVLTTGNGTVPSDVWVWKQLTMNLNGSVFLDGVELRLGVGSPMPGILSHVKGQFTGSGSFSRFIKTDSLFGFDDPRGLFPMGDGTNARYLSLSTLGASWYNGHTGGFLTVGHQPATTSVPVLPSFSDAAVTVDTRHEMNWTVGGYGSTGTLRGQGLAIRIRADGIDGLNSINDVRLVTDAGAVGTHGGTAGTLVMPLVSRSGLSCNTQPRTLNNTFYIGSNSTINPLPVELVSFTARALGGKVRLSWSTATELNNYGFEVQRAEVGGSWEVLGFVAGKGSCNSPSEYSYEDTPVVWGGRLRYRLRQIDRDGGMEYSPEVEILPESAGLALHPVSPNPLRERCDIRFTLDTDVAVTVELYDMLGRRHAMLLDGWRRAGAHALQLDAAGENLRPGQYLLLLRTATGTRTQRLLVLR
ncbi:MAG TPA: T9SS type A sorting domain-containing protein [Bacteroidota bacterium]|nr:T9SS type A sorting domain-containing protein [Bacteroidota bacterium]